MSYLYCGSLGTVTSATSSDAVYIGHLTDCVVTLNYDYTGTFLDNSAAATIQVSQDGTRWAPTTATSACSYSAPSKSFQLTGRHQFARVTATHCTYGTFSGHYSGRQADLLYAKFGTLGDVAGATAQTAVDVGELDKVIVTSTGGASSTVKIQTSYDGTDWITVSSVTTAGSLLIPLPCKLLRANCTVYSAAAYVRYGGHKADGKQRFGTLGDFDTTETGTSVDVSDLDTIGVYAEFTGSGTFAASLTVLIEGSSDGTSWTTVPSGSLTSSGSLSITAAYKLLRARCSVFSIGSAKVRFGGIDTAIDG